MERRYQVFVSSTFVDLEEERREVMQALLEMDCLPAGMELFPASNDDQWSLIQGVIEESDYCLVILGGRYGSTTAEGISYTEKEYDYAVEQGIPVMGYVPANREQIPVGKTDQNDSATRKLDAFRTKVQRKMTKEWSTSEDLGSKVTRGLMHLIKNNPRPGWVRGDSAMTPEIRVEMAELKSRIAEFEKKDFERETASPTGINEAFAHGDETIRLSLTYSGLDLDGMDEDVTIVHTWDEVFQVLGPSMLNEASEPSLRTSLNRHLVESRKEQFADLSPILSQSRAEITDISWGNIIVQLRALQLITAGTKKRAVSDRSAYWKLTQAGDDYLVSLRAVPSSK